MIPFPNPYLIMLGLEHDHPLLSGNHPHAREPARSDRAWMAMAVISVKFFSLDPVLHRHRDDRPGGGATGATTTGQVRWQVGLGSLALLLLFLVVITFLDQPIMLIGTLAVPAISLAVSAPGDIARRPGCS